MNYRLFESGQCSADTWERGVHVNPLSCCPLLSWGTSPAPPMLTPGLPEDGTHLEDTHAEGVAQDLVRLVVVAVANVGGGDKEFKGVVLLYVQSSVLYFFL